MTQEVLNCLRGERSGENKPSGLMPPPLTQGRQESEDVETPAQEESAEEALRPGEAGPTPLPGEAAEQSGTESREKAGVPDARMLREHLALLQEQAAQIPGFDLKEALQDPAFVRLTAPGVGVSVTDAWYALHRKELESRRAEEERNLLARAAAASANRPREGGGTGAALIAADYRKLPRDAQLHIKQRILEASARGEKIYP